MSNLIIGQEITRTTVRLLVDRNTFIAVGEVDKVADIQLHEKIMKLDDIWDCDYNGHFGLAIIVTTSLNTISHEWLALLDHIEAIIEEHIEGVN